MRPRLARAAGSALALALACAGAAAHVSLETPEARLGAPYKAVFKVPHGCEGSPTVEIGIDIPEGVIGVKPMPKPGWTIDLLRGPYARVYAFHGKTLREGVKRVVWRGGPLPDAYFDEFVLSAFIARELQPGTVHFPVMQKCEQGTMHWSEVPAAGQDSHALAAPAPGLLLTAAEGETHAAHEHAAGAGELAIAAPWTPVPPAGATVAAGYLAITNSGTEPDVLMGAASPAAERIELHATTVTDDGVARMRRIEDGVKIGPGETVELKPAGMHLMLIGLKGALKDGDTFKATLDFRRAGPVEVTFTARKGGRPHEHHDH